MKTLLVLAGHPDFAEAVRAGINPEQYRVIDRADLDEAEPLLAHGLAEACIVDVELEWRWGYPVIWVIMVGIGVSMLLYFRKKKWL